MSPEPNTLAYHAQCMNHNLLTGHHPGWRHLSQRALAQGVLHLHPLRQVPRRPEVHVQGRQALLRRVLRRALLQAVHRLLQADHRSVP
jgi:hypothetical protein